MKITTDEAQVYLRPMTIDDTDLIVKWRNNPRVRNNFIYQKPFTREGHIWWLEHKVQTGEVIQFVVCLKENDRPVGSVYFRDINEEHHKAEYGIFLGEDDILGRGIGNEVCSLACEYGFREQHWHKIILRAFSTNEPALRSYAHAGFVKEALLKDEVCIDGIYRDIVLMGFINPYE